MLPMVGGIGIHPRYQIVGIAMQGLRIAIPAAALLVIPSSAVRGFLESMPAWLNEGMTIGGGMVEQELLKSLI